MAASSPGTTDIESTLQRFYNINSDPLHILEFFIHPSSSKLLFSYLRRGELSDNCLSLLVHLVSKACTSRVKREDVNRLLIELSDTPIIGFKGTQLLVGVTCTNQSDHGFNCLLGDFRVIIHEMFERMPHLCSTPTFLGLLEFLLEQIREMEDAVAKGTALEQISQIKKGIVLLNTESPKRRKRIIHDHEDDIIPPDNFRDLPIVPTASDILEKPNVLRRNKILGKYLSVDHYLDVQFRLYREDCFAPLREAVHEYLVKQKAGNRFRLENGLIYRGIKVMHEKKILLDAGEVFLIRLDPDHCKRINWMTSSRLIYGSLLLLSFDQFKTFFLAIIAESDRLTLRKKGYFAAQIYNPFKNQNLPKDVEGVMIEATSAYFESYKYVLQSLKLKTDDSFPFLRYIVFCEQDVDTPSYIPDKVTYDLYPVILRSEIRFQEMDRSQLRATENLMTVDINIFEDKWPPCNYLGLDKSQREAFISALTKEFVLIQGPPGTGKTYLGLQIARALLHNSDKWSSEEGTTVVQKPTMLIVCYTNHALDQFVEGIMDFLPDFYDGHYPNIVRIGNRSKSEKVMKMSLKNVRRKLRKYRNTGGVLETAEQAKEEIKDAKRTIEILEKRNIVVNFVSIRHCMSEIHGSQFGDKPQRAWYEWLHVTREAWYKEVEKTYQSDVSDHELLLSLNEAENNHEKDMVTVVSDAEYALNERYFEVDDSFNTNHVSLLGLDLDKQLQDMLNDKSIEEKCRLSLGIQKTSACNETHFGHIMTEDNVESIENLWTLSVSERWSLYRYWLTQFLRIKYQRLQENEQRFVEVFERYKKESLEMDEDIIQNTRVVAMTTTNAARYSESLNKIGPLITIVEEAAEVPESHIITAINQRCKHLILIGDHCQLEPKPAVYELGRYYNLSISLFERMVKNELHYHCLQRQHRMRPEIASLVRHIYPVLDDNENVLEYPPVKGVRKSLYFVSHNNKETYKDEGKSFSNEFEAEYLKELCSYLIKQGYKNTDITIIAAYSGQMYRIRDKMPRFDFEGVNICVLDNYQGEENEIILLSLVRSNENGDIGFLSRKNRICVALSRAKQGLFILGNKETLEMRSEQWRTVINKLSNPDNKNGGAFIGRALPLYCQNHPNEERVKAALPSDFNKVPDGGCLRPCEFRLECGHACRYKCHPFDREHKAYVCKKPCSKRCSEGHVCKKQCHFNEDCYCGVPVLRTLKCGHTEKLKCHIDFLKYNCDAIVERTLNCGHITSLKCHEDYTKHKCRAKVTGTREKCGHEFTRHCYNLTFEENTVCTTTISEIRPKCGHNFERECHDTYFIERRKCEVVVIEQRSDCGHDISRPCFDKSYASKTKCKVQVEEQWPDCKHTYQRQCHNKEFRMKNRCTSKINDIRSPCGHEYERPCFDVDFWRKTKCMQNVLKAHIDCSHMIQVKCHTDMTKEECQETVSTTFDCQHTAHHKCFEKKLIACIDDCKKKCANGHICKKKCHFPTPCECKQPISIILEKCQHKAEVLCSADIREVKCKKPVEKIIERCGHTQNVMCHVLPDTYQCQYIIPKLLPKCGHKQNMMCSQNVTEFKCNLEVLINLRKCNHEAKVKCFQKEQVVRCKRMVTVEHPACKHEIQIPCWRTSEDLLQANLPPCKAPVTYKLSCGHTVKTQCDKQVDKCTNMCASILKCGHQCPGKCQSCRDKREHDMCKRPCQKELFCGHACESKSCMNCKPCKKPCSFGCLHQRCRRNCIEECKPCRQKCRWECVHFRCTNYCFEVCNRPICNEDCDIVLKCGHRCSGLCGEPCPPSCFFCLPTAYPDIKSKPWKTVVLPDCGHSFSSATLDQYMEQIGGEFGHVPKCPSCNTIVSYHPRYDRIIKQKRKLIEQQKQEVKKALEISANQIFPACLDIKHFEQYYKSCGTYIHITKHLTKECAVLDALDKTQTVINILDKTTKNIDTRLSSLIHNTQISDDIFRLFLHWVYCVLQANTNLLKKDDMYVCQSKEENDETHATGQEVMEKAFNMIGQHTHDVIEELIGPMVDDQQIKENKHIRNALRYTRLDYFIGIHTTDWTYCDKGHLMSTVLRTQCRKCNGRDDLPEQDVGASSKPKTHRFNSGYQEDFARKPEESSFKGNASRRGGGRKGNRNDDKDVDVVTSSRRGRRRGGHKSFGSVGEFTERYDPSSHQKQKNSYTKEKSTQEKAKQQDVSNSPTRRRRFPRSQNNAKMDQPFSQKSDNANGDNKCNLNRKQSSAIRLRNSDRKLSPTRPDLSVGQESSTRLERSVRKKSHSRRRQPVGKESSTQTVTHRRKNTTSTTKEARRSDRK